MCSSKALAFSSLLNRARFINRARYVVFQAFLRSANMNLFFGLLLAALPLLTMHQADSAPCLAQLTLTQQSDVLHIDSACRSRLNQPAHYRYELHAQRHSAAGQSNTTQRGSFELAAQQQVQLSQVGLNVRADDHYHIHLLVFDDAGRAVAQDSVVR